MVAFQEVGKRDLFATKSILVVEDDLELATMLKNIIEECGGKQVILAANGFHALEILQSMKPDCFLFDYHLPGIDGIKLYQLLHSNRAFAHIPVLFLSAHAAKEVFEAHHLSYLSKPFEVEDFLQKIEALLTG